MVNKGRRVVITGLGVISSIGIGWQSFWDNLIAGKSGISKIESFDTSMYDRHYGGEIKNFDPENFINRRRINTIGKVSQMAIATSHLAIDDSRLELEDIDREKFGVYIGTTMAEIGILQEMDYLWVTAGDESVDRKLIDIFPPSIITANVAIEFRLKGRNFLFANACAAGNYAIGYSYDLIKFGRADMMLAGGADEFSKVNHVGFSRLFAVAPEKCQPFDKNRQGMLVGEGSGIVVLENLESALNRGAKIYAEVLGYGLSCDAFHMTAPSEEGIVDCMKKALDESGVGIGDIDYISAHGTGTQQNDKTECSAIKNVFGKRYKKIPISSIKSMLGHTMGAASAIEAISCCLAIKEDIIPPTINYEKRDPDCNIDCVPNVARKQEVNMALNNSYAFGGNNACLVLRKYT